MKQYSKQNKKARGKKSKISFDNEIIRKDQAEKLLAEQGFNITEPGKQSLESSNDNPEYRIKEKKKKHKQVDQNLADVEKSTAKKKQKSEQKSENQVTENSADSTVDTEPEPQETTNQPKKESIRAQKRKKHAKHHEEKRLKAELEFQKNALSYLSNWKHCRSEWKFEKLKQVWIQHNLFNTSKIPDEFWETAIEYFSGTKGHSRKLALDEALKIIEKEDESSEGDLDEDYQVKMKRARDIVQSLQD